MSRRQFLVVEAGGDRFAVECEQVHGLLRRAEVRPGCQVRDLGRELGVEPAVLEPEYALQAQVSGRPATFRIDQAHDVVTVEESGLYPLPSLVRGAAIERGIRHAFVLGETVVLVVDLSSLPAGQAGESEAEVVKLRDSASVGARSAAHIEEG